MLQIKYNSAFIDIDNTQSYEITRNSPLFLLDEIMAEYSTPITIKYTDNNARLLGFLFFDITQKIQTKFEVELYINGTYRCAATLVIESAGMNRQHQHKASLTGYLLTGISSFFTLVKDKMLNSLSFGGIRTFDYTTDDPTDGSAGYWQHFNKIYDFSDDYVMPPCWNQAAVADDDPEFAFSEMWMNRFDGASIGVKQPVYPWPKLSYILNQCFAENGWTLDTSGINDTEWQRLLLYSNYNVSTTGYTSDGATFTGTPSINIQIDLSKAVPQDYTIPAFILQICKRYFWFPYCDAATRTCRLIALKDVTNTPVVKDWTRYASSVLNSDFTAVAKVIAFKTDFKGDDQYPAAPTFTDWPFIGYADSFNVLPPPDDAQDNALYYTFLENKWWKMLFDNTDGSRTWTPFADNIYDKDNGNATDTYETEVSTLPIENHQFENGHHGLVPLVNQARKTAWGIRTVIYHGMVRQVDAINAPLSLLYPYASSTNTPPAGFPKLTWSNVFEDSNFFTEYGLINYWYQRWLDISASVEIITQNFYLPYSEIMQLKWTDVILINNHPFVIKSFIETLSAKPYIQAQLQKVALITQAVPPTPPPPPTEALYTEVDVISADHYNESLLQHYVAEASATITFKIVTYTESLGAGFVFTIDSVVYILNDTFTKPVDADGNGFFVVTIAGPHTSGKAFEAQVQMISVDAGTIGSPALAEYAKFTDGP